jgi:hypothetical protein
MCCEQPCFKPSFPSTFDTDKELYTMSQACAEGAGTGLSYINSELFLMESVSFESVKCVSELSVSQTRPPVHSVKQYCC